MIARNSYAKEIKPKSSFSAQKQSMGNIEDHVSGDRSRPAKVVVQSQELQNLWELSHTLQCGSSLG